MTHFFQIVPFVIFGALAAAVGGLWVWGNALAGELERKQVEASSQHERALDLERALAVAEERVRTLEEELDAEEPRFEALKAQMAQMFAQIGDEQLKRGSTQLVQLADERFNAQKIEVQGELEKRKAVVDEMLRPFGERLKSLDEKLNMLESKREGAYATVSEQIGKLSTATEQLKTETLKFSSSLRNAGTRGRWGEFQLRRVVETAGMSEYCDFSEQSTERDEQGVSRPDMIVRIPGDRRIPIDAKVPLSDYLDACEAEDADRRTAALTAHARAVLSYALELGKRDYTRFEAMSDFVVMFVPNEAALGAALSVDPNLLDRALERGIHIVGPLSLIALLRAYAAGWIVVQQERSAREIAQAGRELYKRLAIFAEHLDGVGDHLRRATLSFNKAIGSYRDRLEPKARDFERFGASDAAKPVPTLEEIDVVPAALPGASPGRNEIASG